LLGDSLHFAAKFWFYVQRLTLERDTASCASATNDRSHAKNSSFDLEKVTAPVHFVGIGGIGMSAIARLLLAQGKRVSGSDQSESEITRELAALGAKTFVGHQATNVKEAGVVVVSTAISKTNPELVFAQENDLPILHRSDLLAQLSKASKLVAVSGTHGKTTTTGMVAQVLLECGLDPSVVVGGIFDRIGSNARFGRGGYFVAEADESDRTHADVTSYISIVTNIEADHLENYPGGLTQIKNVMLSFANNSERAVVICIDDLGCREILSSINRPVVTYGQSGSPHSPDYSFESLPGHGMRVYKGKQKLGDLTLAVPGEHNKQNSLAAIVVGLLLDLPFEKVAAAVSQFKGVDRRFQILGEENGILVVDDYAHHPTEVVATLQAARQFIDSEGRSHKRRLVAMFQPHQPGRLRDLWSEFVAAFKLADVVILADIYVARGKAIEGVTSERFAQEVDHKKVHYIKGQVSELVKESLPLLQAGDLVLTIGAGDITNAGPQILQHLKCGHSHG
jgi:UDP-N-acetylmuramate--alanine ligase